jgi:hypothetical protein
MLAFEPHKVSKIWIVRSLVVAGADEHPATKVLVEALVVPNSGIEQGP